MPRKIDGVEYYTKAEIDQRDAGGYVASLANRNALSYVITAASWTAQVGGDLDGWSYADVVHNRTTAALAYVAAFRGADSRVYIVDGSNAIQDEQDNTTVRIWLQDAPSYDLLCLVVYA